MSKQVVKLNGEYVIKEGGKYLYRITKGGGTCYYMVLHGDKWKILGPYRKEIALKHVEDANRAGVQAKYLGPKPRRYSLASLL